MFILLGCLCYISWHDRCVFINLHLTFDLWSVPCDQRVDLTGATCWEEMLTLPGQTMSPPLLWRICVIPYLGCSCPVFWTYDWCLVSRYLSYVTCFTLYTSFYTIKLLTFYYCIFYDFPPYFILPTLCYKLYLTWFILYTSHYIFHFTRPCYILLYIHTISYIIYVTYFILHVIYLILYFTWWILH